MRLELIFLMSLVSVIYGTTHVLKDSRFLPSLRRNLNTDSSPENNYKPKSTIGPFEMQKSDMNCFVNINNQNDKIFLLSFGSAYEPIARRRATIHGWTIAEPLYVDEPKWILIEDSKYPQTGQRNYINNKVDPFYITRGKRITMDHIKDHVIVQKSSLPHMNGNIAFANTKLHSEDAVSGDSEQQIYHQMNRVDTASTMRNDERHLRDKHSDIMDMLVEPFVISRGKKNQNGRKEHINFFDAWKLYDNISPRNRRGELVDQLMKENDPFYVARGKRNPHL